MRVTISIHATTVTPPIKPEITGVSTATSGSSQPSRFSANIRMRPVTRYGSLCSRPKASTQGLNLCSRSTTGAMNSPAQAKAAGSSTGMTAITQGLPPSDCTIFGITLSGARNAVPPM